MKDNSELAVNLFKSGYNCSQSVVLVYCDELNVDKDTILRLSSSFGGGMGRLREVCGAVSAMFMIVGLKYGYTDPNDKILKQKHYELIQELANNFKERYGSIICRELLDLKVHNDNPIPETRNQEYYLKRYSCMEAVRSAVEILDEVILRRNENANK